jgi:hypothetical protein
LGGGDIGQVNDLAQEIAAHPETIKEIRERIAVRRKVKKKADRAGVGTRRQE